MTVHGESAKIVLWTSWHPMLVQKFFNFVSILISFFSWCVSWLFIFAIYEDQGIQIPKEAKKTANWPLYEFWQGFR